MAHDLFPKTLFQAATSWRNQLDKRLQPLGLTQAKWRTLFYLGRAKKVLKQTELAAKMGVEDATVVGLIDRLERDGWVLRKPDNKDRRSKNIHLTDKAKPVVKDIQATALKLKNELAKLLPEGELENCIASLQKISQTLDSL
jgi:MarR family transcriptional regulator for hemolysin